MVHLTTRFAVLAVAIAALNSVDVVAMPAGHSKSGIASKAASHHNAPVLPLPLRMEHGSKASRKGDSQEKTKGVKGNDEATHKGGKKHGERQKYDNNARGLNQAFFRRVSRPHPRHGYADKVVVNGNNDRVHVSDHDHHGHHWSDDKVIVNGDNAHVHVKDRRSSSSVLVHNNHGQSFLVSRTHRAITRRNAANLGKRDAHWGTINLMSRNDAGQPKKLGALLLNTKTAPASLDASESYSTSTHMVEDPNTMRSQDSNVKFVQLLFPIPDPQTLAEVAGCATYNSSPDDPAPMTVIPCHNLTEPSNPQESQTFMYFVNSGTISPMGASSPASAQDVAAGEDMMESGTSFQARDTAQTQDVTLTFTQEDSVRAQAAEDAVTTVTETVTATVTAPSNSPSAAAQDMDSSSSLSTTASASSLTVSSSSSTPSINALKVEVFGAPSSDVTSSSSMTGPSASSSTCATPMSSAINAEAVAAGIANPSSSTTDPLSSASSTATSLSSTASIVARAVDTAPYQWQFRREA